MEANTSLLSHRGGLSAANRVRLTRLHRELPHPFGVSDAAPVLALNAVRVGRFLAYLASRGWLTRIRRGMYTTVPLDASEPSDWRVDPWVVASRAFKPCYIGGWSAAEHWGLTDQLFRVVVVFTAKWTRNRRPTIQETSYRVKVVEPHRIFGTKKVWRGNVPVPVADPSRTIVDVLDDPRLGGGLRHVAEMLSEYLTAEHRSEATLLEYAALVGNRSVYKRLGYLIEAVGLDAAGLVDACRTRMSSGVVLLDPWSPRRGKIVTRWRVRVNVRLPR